MSGNGETNSMRQPVPLAMGSRYARLQSGQNMVRRQAAGACSGSSVQSRSR